MTTIAFFGHDAADAAVRRRVKSFTGDGMRVIGFMMRRRDVSPEWQNVDLGMTRDGAFFHRIKQIFAGARKAAAQRDLLEQADVIYARNLDMLACAFLAKRHTGLKTPVIYESLDVHRLLTRGDFVGRTFRGLERSLLKRTRALVVSSPGFLKNHFERHYSGDFTAYVVENRLSADSDFGPRPNIVEPSTAPADRKLVLGWVGMLRCQRSLDLLCELADAFPDSLEIRLHGIPARTEIPVFEPEIDRRPNMTFFGKFRSPEDLADIYGSLDLVWAGDFMEAGYNSVWLLPNRIYEGGYYATPSIAPADTETAAWIQRNDCGFVISEPLEQSLANLVGRLLQERREITAFSARLASLPEELFVQPAGFMRSVISSSLRHEVAA
ncbi:glycosyl transferase [Hyphomonas sp.]|jgi:succinoglycan biosynthesis protein ExoL|uniref:glycosyl transferase n=1 Tax=Hyphomonas sp. TaxID=87 RepID=UPI0032D8F86B